MSGIPERLDCIPSLNPLFVRENLSVSRYRTLSFIFNTFGVSDVVAETVTFSLAIRLPAVHMCSCHQGGNVDETISVAASYEALTQRRFCKILCPKRRLAAEERRALSNTCAARHFAGGSLVDLSYLAYFIHFGDSR